MAPSIVTTAEIMNMVTGRSIAVRGTDMRSLLSSPAGCAGRRAAGVTAAIAAAAATTTAPSATIGHQGHAVAVAQGEGSGRDHAVAIFQTVEDFDTFAVRQPDLRFHELCRLLLDGKDAALAIRI